MEAQSLKNADIPSVALLGEESRRMKEIYRAYGQQMAGMADMFQEEYTIVLNKSNSLVQKLDSLNGDDKKLVCEQIYDLAMISLKPLGSEEMAEFISRNTKLLNRLF